jgi:tRNA(adenine34) deaminase
MEVLLNFVDVVNDYPKMASWPVILLFLPETRCDTLPGISINLPSSFFSASMVTVIEGNRGEKSSLTDYDFMALALDEALHASQEGEVPVGAVLVNEGRIIARDHNRPISAHDPTAHAETLVLRAAAAQNGNYRLNGGALYVTIEPCIMCAGAILQSRISRLIFGARDEKGGAITSLYCLLNDSRLNHQVEVTEGVLAEQCREMIKAFFNERR